MHKYATFNSVWYVMGKYYSLITVFIFKGSRQSLSNLDLTVSKFGTILIDGDIK